MEGLRAIFGNDVTKNIRRTTETAWRSNPFTIGAYSHALPNGAAGREVLAEHLDNRVYFAGEATMPNAYATVHGAYLSGLRAAREISEFHL